LLIVVAGAAAYPSKFMVGALVVSALFVVSLDVLFHRI
jgi:hypothetical protein